MVDRDFTGFPVAKVAFLLDFVALVSKSAVEVVAFIPFRLVIL